MNDASGVAGLRRRDALRFGAACVLAQAHLPAQAAAQPLRFGLTAVILADQAAFLTRWADYLAPRCGSPVTFVVRESYQSILDLMFADQLDAAWICGYPYVRHQAQLRLLAVPLYRGVPRYQSYLIRTRGSTLSGWADLRGKVLAYSDPLSNSGWLVAQRQLRLAGLAPHDLRRSFFAHGHRNVAEAVAAGLAQAGCIDGYVWETMQLQGMPSVAHTEVIWRSAEFGFPPIVARAGKSTAQSQGLATALMHMPDDPLGRDLLKALNLTGFTSATPALFDSIRELAGSVAAGRS